MNLDDGGACREIFIAECKARQADFHDAVHGLFGPRAGLLLGREKSAVAAGSAMLVAANKPLSG